LLFYVSQQTQQAYSTASPPSDWRNHVWSAAELASMDIVRFSIERSYHRLHALKRLISCCFTHCCTLFRLYFVLLGRSISWGGRCFHTTPHPPGIVKNLSECVSESEWGRHPSKHSIKYRIPRS